MKKVILLLTVFASKSFAGGSWVSSKDLSRYVQCTPQETRAFTSVGSYIDWCDFQRKSNIGQHGDKSPVWFVTLPGNRSCYAPCDYSYEDQVQRGN